MNLDRVREWIKAQPPATLSYSKSPPTLISSLSNIGAFLLNFSVIKDLQISDVGFLYVAWLLNLRGSDIPHDPLFNAYLFIGLRRVVLFVDGAKVPENVSSYLKSVDVERREYHDLWSFLRRWE